MQYENNREVKVRCLGQAGFRLEFAGAVIYVDPYLSNSVQENEGEDLVRLKPIAVPPEKVNDADWVFISHEHRDHCDPDTLLPISRASKDCVFFGPLNVVHLLEGAGIGAHRLELADFRTEKFLAPTIGVHTVPAAHPRVECNFAGLYRWLGYVFRFGDRFIYHAGDTSVCPEVLTELKRFEKIDVAFLPVNEKNYYRNRRGIIGNMSVREAFHFAEEIGAGAVVPMHWDMFENNTVFREEIELVYNAMAPDFQLLIEPETV